MKSMKLGVWVLVGMGLAMLLSVGVLGSEGSVSAQDSTDPILVGAGDIAGCGTRTVPRIGDEATAKLLDTIVAAAPSTTTVFTTGDNAYESGTAFEFANCYDPTWGKFKARTMPSPGNHEYYDSSEVARPYFDYFSATNGFEQPAAPVPNDPVNDNDHGLKIGEGYYSYDRGSWHMISLNSNCSFVAGGGCAAGSDQVRWLKADLAAHSNACTLAYWHHPLFSSGSTSGGNSKMKPFWEALYAAKADVVLNGHVHNFEVFRPQTPSGVANPAGIREFVVGTGGYSLNAFKTTVANSQERYRATNGVLKLTLHSTSYDWRFVAEDGTTPPGLSGSDSCDPDGTTLPDTTPPTVESTIPSAKEIEVAPTIDVTATFSEKMMETSINGTTFKLVKLNADGTTTKVTADVSYDVATKKAILNPSGDLSPGGTYKATVTSGAQDLQNNALDQKPNIAGNQNKSWKFTVQ